MQSSGNDGKYAMREWWIKRHKALIDRNLFTDNELIWLDITSDQGRGADNPETYRIYNSPSDARTIAQKRDMRKNMRR